LNDHVELGFEGLGLVGVEERMSIFEQEVEDFCGLGVELHGVWSVFEVAVTSPFNKELDFGCNLLVERGVESDVVGLRDEVTGQVEQKFISGLVDVDELGSALRLLQGLNNQFIHEAKFYFVVGLAF
jgi:hypothetical protein